MKVKPAFFLFPFFSPSLLFSHQVPVSPVTIQFHVESAQVRAHISMESDYWMEDVLGLHSPPPPTHWAPELQEVSGRAIDESMSLKVDGVPLQRTSLSCRFVEEPMRVVPSRFEFEATYPLPADGEVLSGRIQFFKEEYEHYVEARRPVDQSFVSHLHFSGRSQIRADLPLDKPDFEFALADLRKTSREFFVETFKATLIFFLFGSLFPFYCLAIFLVMQENPLLYKGIAALVWVAFVGGSIGFLERFIPLGPTALWAFLGMSFLLPVFSKRNKVLEAIWILVVCGKVWPSFLILAAEGLPFPREVSSYVSWALFSGFLASSVIHFLAFGLVVRLRRDALRKSFGETAPRLYQLDIRALSGFLLFFSVMQIIKLQILK